jgi:WD40 repeat protein
MKEDDLRGPDTPPGIQAASFSPDGRTLLTGSYDGRLALWDVGAGTGLARLKRAKRVLSVLTVCFSSDGTWFAVGNAAGRVAIRDARSCAVLCGWEAHESGIMALDISPDGSWLATGAREPGGTTLHVWRIGEKRDSATEAFSDHRHVTAVYAVCFSEDSRFLAAGGWTNSGYTGSVVYELETGHRVASLIWEAARSLRFSPDGTILASGEEFGKITLWDVRGQSRLREIKAAHEDIVSVLRFSPDGCLLASGGVDGRFKIWDTASGALCIERECAGVVLDCYYAGSDEWLVAAAQPEPEAPPQIIRSAGFSS